MSKLALLPHFNHLINICSVTFSLSSHGDLQDITNELWRDGFDWISLKVISKAGKARFGFIVA